MKIDILGVKVDPLTQKQFLDKVEEFLLNNNSEKKYQLITANAEIVLAGWQNENYQDLINSSSLVTADGIGLLWAAKFLSLKSSSLLQSLIQVMVTGLSLVFYPKYCKDVLPERVTGVDSLEKICERASKKNWPVYFLGGEKGIAKKTAEVLKRKYINLNIAGAESGPQFEFNNPEHKNIEVINQINNSKAKILFVAFGAPKQDFWIQNNLPKLKTIKVAMGVGGSFNFISGKSKRAPEIYGELGLEWLHRFIHQPWRALRIFQATVGFTYNVVKFKHKINA